MLATFNSAVAAVDAAGLKSILDNPGQESTLFAPTNAAFDKLPDGLVVKLLDQEWQPQLVDLLKYHMVAGKVMAANVTNGMTVKALNEEELIIRVNKTVVVDKGNATVVAADVVASNGVIHALDAVLAPTSVTSSLVDIVAADEDTFSTLVAAVNAADLAETLSGEDPFTVLAPDNDAFAALPAGTVEDLLAPENKDALVGILRYHVLRGNIPSTAVTNGTVTTLGGELEATVGDGKVTFNDAEVIKADVLANNGIIHVIDKVLLPPGGSGEGGSGGRGSGDGDNEGGGNGDGGRGDGDGDVGTESPSGAPSPSQGESSSSQTSHDGALPSLTLSPTPSSAPSMMPSLTDDLFGRVNPLRISEVTSLESPTVYERKCDDELRNIPKEDVREFELPFVYGLESTSDSVDLLIQDLEEIIIDFVAISVLRCSSNGHAKSAKTGQRGAADGRGGGGASAAGVLRIRYPGSSKAKRRKGTNDGITSVGECGPCGGLFCADA